MKIKISCTYGYLIVRFLINFHNFWLCPGRMSQHSTKIILYSDIFVYDYSLLWRGSFRSSTVWSKPKSHILMATWLWDFGQTFTILLLFFWRKWVSMVQWWYFILSFLWIPIHYYEEYILDPQYFNQSQNLTYLWLYDGEILDKVSQFYCIFQEEMTNNGSKMILYPVTLVHAYSFLRVIRFRPSTLSPKPKSHIPMAIWWWDFWQSVTILLFFPGKMS